MTNLFWLWGAIASFCGWQVIGAFKSDKKKNFYHFLFPMVGWWAIYEWGSLYWQWGGGFRLTAVTFAFLGMSPVLGFLFHFQEGRFIRRVLKGILFLGLWWLSYRLAFVFGEMQQGLSLALGLVPPIIMLLPYKTLWQGRRRARREKKQAKENSRAMGRKEAAKAEAFGEQVSKLDYLLEQGLFDEAQTLLEQLLTRFPERRQEVSAHHQRVLAIETATIATETTERYGRS